MLFMIMLQMEGLTIEGTLQLINIQDEATLRLRGGMYKKKIGIIGQDGTTFGRYDTIWK